jgi:hypothetical protein
MASYLSLPILVVFATNLIGEAAELASELDKITTTEVSLGFSLGF